MVSGDFTKADVDKFLAEFYAEPDKPKTFVMEPEMYRLMVGPSPKGIPLNEVTAERILDIAKGGLLSGR